MLLKKFYIVLLVIILIPLISSSAAAETGFVMYNKQYDLDGLISVKMMVGSDQAGGKHKTMIRGEGALFRVDQTLMRPGSIDLYNHSEWFAEPSSPMGLEVAANFRPSGNPENDAEAESHQVFAISVKADRGESGSLTQAISAATHVYGAEEEEHYFYLDQDAFTSGGTVKRYIDLIEPVTGQYLFEDAIIKGYVRVADSLQAGDGSGVSLKPAYFIGDLIFPDNEYNENAIFMVREVITDETAFYKYSDLSNTE